MKKDKQKTLTLNSPTKSDLKRINKVKKETKVKTNSDALRWALEFSELWFNGKDALMELNNKPYSN